MERREDTDKFATGQEHAESSDQSGEEQQGGVASDDQVRNVARGGARHDSVDPDAEDRPVDENASESSAGTATGNPRNAG
jgi:hypothetical protein